MLFLCTALNAVIFVQKANKSLALTCHCVTMLMYNGGISSYSNDPKFLDGLVWANSADPEQTAPRGAV